MKKSELKILSDYFGELPMGSIKDSDIRRAVIKFYCQLAALYKPIAEEMETMRTSVIGDKQQDVITYLKLQQAGDEESIKKANEMEDCVRIESDFKVMSHEILNQNLPDDTELPKIPLDVLYEALADCGFPKLSINAGPSAIANQFRPIIE